RTVARHRGAGPAAGLPGRALQPVRSLRRHHRHGAQQRGGVDYRVGVLAHVRSLAHLLHRGRRRRDRSGAGTLGSTAWARYLVEFGIEWEIDGREIPSDWTSGYLGINTTSPTQKPPLDYRTEVFQLNEALLRKAYALSRDVLLADSAPAQAARSKFAYAPANLPPSVLQCDTASADTWFSGTLLAQRARDWTKILTDGRGIFCTAQQEDNATYEALKRGASAKLVDLDRVAVLRAGSNFLRPYEGQSSSDNLLNYAAQGGFTIALENLYRAGSPLVQEIVDNWRRWRRGAPVH